MEGPQLEVRCSRHGEDSSPQEHRNHEVTEETKASAKIEIKRRKAEVEKLYRDLVQDFQREIEQSVKEVRSVLERSLDDVVSLHAKTSNLLNYIL